MQRIKVLAFIGFLIYSVGAKGQSYPYRFNYLTVDEGLSHTDANSLVQDAQGYIWIATLFGIDRFDGNTIKRFYNRTVPLNNALNNRVRFMAPDRKGNLWLCTEGGLQCFDAKTQQYTNYIMPGNKAQLSIVKLISEDEDLIYALTDNTLQLYHILKEAKVEVLPLALPAGVHFTDMVSGPMGAVYLSSDEGLWILEKDRKFKKIWINCAVVGFDQINLDNHQNILLSTDKQLFLVSPKNGTVIQQYKCDPGMSLKDVTQDVKSNYWLNLGSSLLCLDSLFTPLQAVTGGVHNGLRTNAINRIYIDRSQCLWACSFGSGVEYCDLNQKRFYTIQYDAGIPSGLSGNYIRSILEDGERYLWIGTSYNGLNQYDFITQKCTYINNTHSVPRLQDKSVNALLLDPDHNLWVGTGSGIQILKPGRKEWWIPPGSEDFPKHVIDMLAQDCYGNIWFGDHQHPFGVIWKDSHLHFHVRYYGEGYFLLTDATKPIIFVSSTHGLKRLIVDREGNILEMDDYQATGQPNTLSSNYTYPVCKKDDSTYWIGTIGGGLDRLILHKDASPTITNYSREAGVFTDVEALEIDDSGNLWMGGNGLQYLNPTTGQLIHYDKNDGLQGNSFKVNASYKGSNGRLYFGGINGLNYFNPAEIKPNPINAKPALTDLLINNKSPSYGAPDSAGTILTLGYNPELRLSYLQNNFVAFFSAMHYANPLRCQYRYKLIGYDKDWKYTDGGNPSASYNNLDYSRYTFVVEATNNDGIWSDARAVLPITINPPWWKSLPAKMAYAVLFFTLLLWVYIYQARWYRLKRELAVRDLNEKHYQQQLQFFTNISHEFRTPLTLILGPLEGLMKEEEKPAHQLMLRNVKRLINLINELMNFKKVSDSAIKLQVSPLAIGPFCKSIYHEFENLAISKNITFTLLDQTDEEGGQTSGNYFDAQVLEKILFNLLVNAIKYTNEGGSVTFRVFFDFSSFKPSFCNEFHLFTSSFQANKYIYFLIADTGIGISKESIADIFDRYYRVSKDHLGSGVGLALVKSLTQLHKGKISVYSERYSGTEILIALPWGKDHYMNGEIGRPDGGETFSQLELLDTSVLSPIPNSENHSPRPGTKQILLVDDNAELRAFLRQPLEQLYTIYEAEDGNTALEVASQKAPDLIISDVMMPGMSGIELCKLVKEKFETSHIPFIILSAKDALDTKIEGMESGADYYFSKPLNIDLLLLTIHNVFEQAQKLKLKYTNDYLTEATVLVHTEKDKGFMQKLLTLIETNIQEPDLDVDFLCSHLYISRTKLYQKIKSVSDQSIGDFIKTIRLKKAIQIMTHEDIPLNEVADRIGLQSHSYFSRVFKKEFGISPTQFLQSLKKNA